jgi:16S rRNA (adenine1518-N6/adenine1519-N6)-dimethyltransferase
LILGEVLSIFGVISRQIAMRGQESKQRLVPRKSLGQHFLRDPNIVRKILGCIAPQPGDTVLEIGPGDGALTRSLVGAGVDLVAVEIDRRAVKRLHAEFGGKVTIVEGDVLALSLSALARDLGVRKTWRVVGNIPYNITSPILFSILDDRSAVHDATLMMQREVARRLVALPGTRDYGILSVFCRIFAETELLFDVSRNAFRPIPAVTSSVVRLRPFPESRVCLSDEATFRSVVRFVFGQRRKMLRHSLGALAALCRWSLPAKFALRERPEELSPEALADLVNALIAAGMPSPARKP